MAWTAPSGRPGARGGFALPGLERAPDGRCSASSPATSRHRQDLVVDKDATPGEPTLNLRGRDLRFAKLDRTDLHQADLTGANLDGASLVGADLRGAWMSAPTSTSSCSPTAACRPCASRRAAQPTRASWQARMAGIDLRGAKLEAARARRRRLCPRADGRRQPSDAQLERADLSGGVRRRVPTSCWPRCRAPTSPARSCRWPTSPAPRCRAPF